jgi:hypothetical protein
MQEEVRSCANIRVSVDELLDCVMRQDETTMKFFASMFPDGFAATLKHDPKKCEAVFRKDHAQTTT